MIVRRAFGATGLLLFFALTSGQTFASEIRWQHTRESAMVQAKRSGKPILVFVSASWCHFCQEMKSQTWGNPEVASFVSEQFTTLKLDGDRDRERVQALGIRGYPVTMIYTPDGRFIRQKGGFMSSEKLIGWLRQRSPSPVR